jgi:hypothetical protein
VQSSGGAKAKPIPGRDKLVSPNGTGQKFFYPSPHNAQAHETAMQAFTSHLNNHHGFDRR